ncbi:acyltransferase family protein [Massilia aquatica]|uniref:Acyltransferase n=1 Tax=Massilia aquatica TaxID=2609000 RepID=A0ABX0LZS4_9BURK|nr:acyltransferase [Massilia aquatica]NHZ40077.1 acyltransferase [Massilia aquatica]
MAVTIMSSPTRHIPYLDGWRGLAIIAVLISHFKSTQELSWLGEFGVQLFFVLSGFLMGNLLFIKKVPLKDFFVRRVSRVFPTFWLFVIAMAVYAAFVQPVRFVVPQGELIATLAFLRNYFPADISIWARTWPIGHLWSLSVEEHSYMFLAVLAVLAGALRHRLAGAALLLAGTGAILAMNMYYPGHPPAGATPWFLRSESAAIGLVAAAAYRVMAAGTQAPWLRQTSPWLPVLTLVVAIACYSTYAHKELQYTLAPLCLAYSINHLERTAPIIQKLLAARVLQWFGVCSFSLYLWQQPFYYAVGAGRIPHLAGLLGAIGLGALSFYLFENPVRLYLNRKWARRRARPAVRPDTPAA